MRRTACQSSWGHLLRASQFADLLATPPAARTAHFFAHRLSAAQSLVGVMLPKRFARRAVTRSLIKRQIYTQLWLVQERLQARHSAQQYLIRLRAEFDRKAYPSAASCALRCAVREELQTLLARLLR